MSEEKTKLTKIEGGRSGRRADGDAKRRKEEDTRLLIRTYVRAMLHKRTLWEQAGLPYSHTFKVIEDDSGMRIPIEILKDNSVRYVAGDFITDTLHRFAESLYLSPDIKNTHLSIPQINEVVRRWRAHVAPVPEKSIAPVAAASNTSQLCWHRLDFDPQPGDTPVFDEMIGRIDNGPALMAWIGSLLVQESSRDNYVWLYGTGGQGKSRLVAFLKEILGKSAKSEQPPDRNDKFWTSGLVGRRLVVFPDCDNPYFVKSGVFKNLTGEDSVRVEYKGKDPIDMDLNCKFMFISNERPDLSGIEADVRRVIYCEIKPLSEGTKVLSSSEYNRMLWNERSAFIYKCLEAYKKLCPDNSRIESRTDVLEDVIEDNESGYQATFDRFFVRSSKESYVRGSDIVQTFRSIGQNDRAVGKFYSWLERRYGCEVKRPVVDKTDDGKQIRQKRVYGLAYQGGQGSLPPTPVNAPDSSGIAY